MIGSFLTRGIIMAFGYLYPAYECFKVVEKRRPNLDQLKFWCQYWMILALLTVLERVGDAFVDWIPMYNEAKLAFILYLWYPKTQGTSYIYHSFLQPFVARHEVDIDRNLNELKARAGDAFFLYWQKSSIFVQAKFFDLIGFVASQSASRRPAANLNHPPPPQPPPPSPPPPPSQLAYRKGFDPSPPPPYRYPVPPSPSLSSSPSPSPSPSHSFTQPPYEQQMHMPSSSYHPHSHQLASSALKLHSPLPPYQMPSKGLGALPHESPYAEEEELGYEVMESADQIRQTNSVMGPPSAPPIPPTTLLPEASKNPASGPYITRSRKRNAPVVSVHLQRNQSN